MGATFLSHGSLTLNAEVRATTLDAISNAIDDEDDSGDISPVSLAIDVRYRPKRHGFFVGASLGAAEIDEGVDDNGYVTKLGYALETGYSFSKRVYGIVRYQSTPDNQPAYRAVTVGVGYRF